MLREQPATASRAKPGFPATTKSKTQDIWFPRNQKTQETTFLEGTRKGVIKVVNGEKVVQRDVQVGFRVILGGSWIGISGVLSRVTTVLGDL